MGHVTAPRESFSMPSKDSTPVETFLHWWAYRDIASSNAHPRKGPALCSLYPPRRDRNKTPVRLRADERSNSLGRRFRLSWGTIVAVRVLDPGHSLVVGQRYKPRARPLSGPLFGDKTAATRSAGDAAPQWRSPPSSVAGHEEHRIRSASTHRASL